MKLLSIVGVLALLLMTACGEDTSEQSESQVGESTVEAVSPPDVSVPESPKVSTPQASRKAAPKAVEAFVCYGNEPGWKVEIRGDAIVFHGDYGQVVTEYPYAEPRITDEGWAFQTTKKDGSSTLTVTISKESCKDTMAGDEFQFVVSAVQDGNEYHGCGRRP